MNTNAMNQDHFFRRGRRILIRAILGLCILGNVSGCGKAERSDPRAGSSSAAPASLRNNNGPGESLATERRPRPVRKTPQEKARETIAGHEAKLQEAPNAEEAPALLIAAANLYRQKLGDYEKAAEYYLLYVHDYPGDPNISLAYEQLATCYENLGQEFNARWAYSEIMDKFPEESQVHLFAKQKLGLR